MKTAVLTGLVVLAHASETVVVGELGPYPGYEGVAITGNTVLMFDSNSKSVELLYDIKSVSEMCKKPNPDIANSCGIHIHAGTSCDSSDKVLGHYYNSKMYTADPWSPASYVATGTVARGFVDVSFGYTMKDTINRTLVLHAYDGTRATCNTLPGPFWSSPSPGDTIHVKNLGKYPGYTGLAATYGDALLTFRLGYASILYNLEGVEEACRKPNASTPNSCGIHIHAGTSCATASDPGGHYYNTDIKTDPWLAASYHAFGDNRAEGTVDVKFGYDYAQSVGHTFVTHDYAGKRVTCAVLTP